MRHVRALLLADGTSDVPLGLHVAGLARNYGVDVNVVTPEFERMASPPGRQIDARLKCIMPIDPDFELLIVHRDCEGEEVSDRLRELESAMTSVGIEWPAVPIIPVRMTEAWLLLDEGAIRETSGRPSGNNALHLPSVSEVERLPDPKATLRLALKNASGLSGRRLRKFERDFPYHRRQLLEQLDRGGAVSQLSAWKNLEKSVEDAMALLT